MPNNINIIGDRVVDRSKGARLYINDSGVFSLFIINVKTFIFGIRIEGRYKDVCCEKIKIVGKNASKLNTYKNPVSKDVDILGSENKIENCEILGWTFTGIVVSSGAKR